MKFILALSIILAGGGYLIRTQHLKVMQEIVKEHPEITCDCKCPNPKIRMYDKKFQADMAKRMDLLEKLIRRWDE